MYWKFEVITVSEREIKWGKRKDEARKTKPNRKKTDNEIIIIKRKVNWIIAGDYFPQF